MDRQMLDPRRARAIRPDELVARLGLPPDGVVADIGAGPGLLALPLARAVPRGRVIATDVREHPLGVTAARARAAGLSNVETKVVAPDAPGLAPRSIDLALLCQVDHLLADRARYLRLLAQALRPGGRIVIVNYFPDRDAALTDAAAAGLSIDDEWRPSSLFFVASLRQRGAR
jgi:ubiquinone/menaquinone biosynthesis C-methylase UbiE